MDIYRKRIHSFWEEGRDASEKNLKKITDRELREIFQSNRRKVSLKKIGVFCLIFLVLWGGLIALSLPKAVRGYSHAKRGSDLLQTGVVQVLSNPEKAQELFLASSEDFYQASEEIKSMNTSAKLLLVLPNTRSAIHLIRAANELAKIGYNISLLLENDSQKSEVRSQKSIEELMSDKIGSLLNAIDSKSDYLNKISDSLKIATLELNLVNIKYLPKNISRLITTWQKLLPEYQKTFQATLELVNNKDTIFGTANSPKKYLILFQNDTELRPAGGFLGSYATLTIAGDQVQEWWVQKNIYKQDKAFLQNNSIEPPISLKKRLLPVWSLRDSNWAIDFPTAARDVANFYKLEGGTDVNGVLAMDTTVIEDLLRITGSIQVPGYDFTIDSSNFVSRTQQHVELDYFDDPERIDQNEPKKYISDLSEILVTAINTLPKEKNKDLTELFVKAIERKSILISLFDDRLTKPLADLNINGQVPTQKSSDFLYIVNANVRGKKSSRNVWQDAKLETQINSDGSSLERLTITREHKGNGVWPDGDNINLMRILLPKGSELLNYEWQDNHNRDQNILVTEEAGQTAFEVLFNTEIGKTKTLSVTYQVPKAAEDGRYSILHQKQPGAQHCTMEQTIELPSEIQNSDAPVKLTQDSPTSLQTQFEQNRDVNIKVEF